MIRVHKPSPAPAVLTGRGLQETKALLAAFDQARDDYLRGTRTFEDFKGDVYAHVSVKKSLRLAQHEKCAFCESHFQHVGYGDVEHFRPKGGFVQRHGQKLGRPGYYWLAYEWSNLFLSCQLCNQRFKRNLFPLRRPSRRARCHHDDPAREEPLLIDPAAVDPADHVGFRKEFVYPLRGNRVGRTTIEVLGLNRNELVEVRRKRIDDLNDLRETREVLLARGRNRLTVREQSLLTRIEQKLADSTPDAAEYAAMARAWHR
jgi:uncharacterized protein (TIGR02646 family)